MATDSMDHSGTSQSEHILQDVVGCGRFQVVTFVSVFVLGHLSNAFIMPFMVFGGYNPGWRCLDSNLTIPSSNQHADATNSTISTSFVHGSFQRSTPDTPELVTPTEVSSTDYTTDSDHCPVFESCGRVEFLPGTSTIVTEWGLLCDRKWIPALIISLQYAGLLIGATFVGHIGDAFGRKRTMYGASALSCVFGVISIFSTSWQMFAAMRFSIGLSISGFLVFYYVYVVEFVTKRWRSPLPNIPYWPAVCAVFAVVCMTLKDWRHVQITGAIITAISLLPAIWLPESPRWLEVKGKTLKFENAMRKICHTNGKTLPYLRETSSEKDTYSNRHSENTVIENGEDRTSSETTQKMRYSVFHLFKPAYRNYTLKIAIPWFSMSLIFHALSFGVKELSGDFYINTIIMYVVEIPFSPLPMILPNLIGRKPTGIALSGVSGACLVSAAFLYHMTSGYTKTTGVLVLAIAARVTISAFWGVVMTYTVELYPTVVRGLGTSWGNLLNRVGGIVAPFLIPNDPSSFFIAYLVMAVVAFLCSGIVMLLPETKGRKLKENFDEK